MVAAPRDIVAGMIAADVDSRPQAPGRAQPRRPPAWEGSSLRRHGPDALAVIVLLLAAWLSRRGGLPTDGLWLDDTIVGAGLAANDPSTLFAVGFDHPGYAAGLIGWHDLFGSGDAAIIYPAFIAGVLGPPALYLTLRRLGYALSISGLLAAALVATQTHITYSGRLKAYTLDVLVVLALSLVVTRLARLRWDWRIALAWAIGASLAASLSAFSLVAVVVAGALLLLHPASDLRVRVISVAAQSLACAALFAAERATYDNGPLERQWNETWNAFIGFDPNPISFAGDVFAHLQRLAESFPGGPAWLAGVCIVAALAGLVWAAWWALERRIKIVARYALALVVIAAGGSVLEKFPFGPQVGNELSRGDRASLWLVPVVAIGLAAVLGRLRGRIGERWQIRLAFDGVLVAGAVALLVTAGPAIKYPFPGPDSATGFVESELGPNDSLLLPERSNWSFGYESSFATEVEPTPESSVGFVPTFEDRRVHDIAAYTDGPPIDDAIRGADRVFVYYPAHPFSKEEEDTRAGLASTLRDHGLLLSRESFGDSTVDVWSRNEFNLRPGDLPDGWSITPAAPDDSLFACLGVSTDGADTKRLTASGEGRVVISDTTDWPTSAAARRVLAALRGEDAAHCLKTAGVGIGAGVTARRGRSDLGADSVAFEEQLTVSEEPPVIVSGTTAFVFDGRRSILITAVGLDAGGFPPGLFSHLVDAMRARIQVPAAKDGRP